MKLKHILILQNKIDLVKESQAKEQYEQILAFVQGECGSAAGAAAAPNHQTVTCGAGGLSQFSWWFSHRHGC